MSERPEVPETGGKTKYGLKALLAKSEDPAVKLRQRLLVQAAIVACVCLVVIGAVFGLTAAWYTNIVRSDALTVQAQAWGFDGELETPENFVALSAYPGAEGTLTGFKLINNSDFNVKVRMDIDKAATRTVETEGVQTQEPLMTAEMQKRLYFYTLDGANKVWLNSDSPLIFTVPPQARAEGDPAGEYGLDGVHWMWTYDLLGYVVKGSVQGTDLASASVTELEYMQPVEYDLDRAVFDSNGVYQDYDDGSLPLATLLSAYHPVADANTGNLIVVDGYYLLGGDLTTQTGIFLKLLTRDEILDAMAYDSSVGQTPISVQTALVFTGHNIKDDQSGGSGGGEDPAP